MPADIIQGQLNATERGLLTDAIVSAPKKPEVVIEVGTWLGGGSTLHILRALERNGIGHLWGIEANRSIYDQMLANLRAAAPEASGRFTPLFGFSQKVIPEWLREHGPERPVDFAFLDGADNPLEQIEEFELLDPRIPVGGQLMAHDAKLRKGKWLVPYLSRLDNWQTELRDVSECGLFYGRKIAAAPSPASRRAARKQLLKMRCAPIELVASLVPAPICGWVVRAMPKAVLRRIYHNQK